MTSNQFRIAASVALAIFALGCSPASVTPRPDASTTGAITPRDLEVRLTAFAHDSMMGRAAGSFWGSTARDYVATQFARLGVEPGGENGGWFQVVPGINPRDTSMQRGSARNVIGIIRGSDPALRGQYVSITAHNDHIGYSRRPLNHDSIIAFNAVVRPLGADSPNRPATSEEVVRIRSMLDSTRPVCYRWDGMIDCATLYQPGRPDSIFNGADDDGSGTIALIEMAEAFMKGGVRPKRSILFVSHTAEEVGLRGSAWYTDHPTVPIDSIVAEIDVDMIGRGGAADRPGGGPTYLEVVGLRRLSKEFGDWFEASNAKEKLPFVFNFEYDAPGHPQQYYCRADHYSYARYGIPSVSISRGAHRDYHQVTDEAQYIGYTDYARLTQMVFNAATAVANAPHRPRLDGPKPTNPKAPCRQ